MSSTRRPRVANGAGRTFGTGPVTGSATGPAPDLAARSARSPDPDGTRDPGFTPTPGTELGPAACGHRAEEPA